MLTPDTGDDIFESTSSLGTTVPRTVGSIPSSSSLTSFAAGDEGIEPPP